ncbi:MAG: hypothetical protein DI539_05635 [Flavobacterium psychrophilum]|nr:MAG: hypothetical protein DI539_05635 [Flavobacterium psychrophilum]
MRKKIFGCLFLLCICIFLYILVKGYLYKKEIEENKAFTVGQYVRCRQYPKTTQSYFEYYVDNKLYRSSYGSCPHNSEKKLQHFFVIAYSKIDRFKIEVDFSKEVTDTTEILNAGFRLMDGKIR